MNRNAVPFDPRPPAVSSGLRIGTPALATRGLQADDFREVGKVIGETLTGDFSDDKRSELSQRTRALAERYPLYPQLSRSRLDAANRAGVIASLPSSFALLPGSRFSRADGGRGTLLRMDELDALWAFLVAAVIAFSSRRPPPASPAASAWCTTRASATCTTTRFRGWAGWRSWSPPSSRR